VHDTKDIELEEYYVIASTLLLIGTYVHAGRVGSTQVAD